MKLIRRRTSPNPAQKGFSVLKLALRGLVVQRIARNAFRAYKLARRMPLILGGAAVAIFALKKLRGGGNDGPETWTAPPAAPAPAPIQTSGAGASKPSTPSTPASSSPGPSGGSTPSTPASSAPAPDESPVETAATGTPPVEDEAPGTPTAPDIEADGAPDPDIAVAAAATDAGTTGGASEAVEADAPDAATTIGDDLAAAADEGAKKADDT